MKTEEDLGKRPRNIAMKTWPAVLIITVISLSATVLARRNSFENYLAHPISFLFPCAVLSSLMVILTATRKRHVFAAFLG